MPDENVITSFQVKGTHTDKSELVEQVAAAASKIIGVMGPISGHWECTADVAVFNDERNRWEGRMKFVFREGML